MSFEKEDYLDFERVFYYIASAGTDPIQPADHKILTDSYLRQSVRPELYQYFNEES